MKRLFSFLLCLLLSIALFGGCQQEPADISGEPSNESGFVPDTAPIQEGTLESTQLGILPWDSGRTEFSGCGFAAETENGIYLSYMSVLYYADKSDLSSWIPVCPDADCDHARNRMTCSSFVAGRFCLKDGRIFL